MTGFAGWVKRFEAAAEQRQADGDPPWTDGIRLHPALIRSLQRFQLGEDGDGACLVDKATRTGDPEYLAAVRLFVAEERHHARLLRLLLASAGAPTIAGHWSDTVFVALRRMLGLRLELMTLMLAEVIALRYYEALRDTGSGHQLLTDVAGRILLDEQRHVPFHCQRLRADFAHLHPALHGVVAAGWWLLMAGVTTVVALNHGSALRAVGVGRARFAADTARMFRTVVAEVLGRRRSRGALTTRAPVSRARRRARR
jgi:hypothetical protein